MKTLTAPLMLVALLAGLLLAFCPLVPGMMHQALAPLAVDRPHPAAPPPGITYLEKVEDLVFALTNQARRTKGLAPLSQDGELRHVARAYSNDMLVRRFFDHSDPDGVPFDERILTHYRHWVRFTGENLWSAYGYKTSDPQKLAKEIVADWMSSPGHRANLLDPDFTHLGVGVSARHGTIRATQEFVGRPRVFSLGELTIP